MRDLRFGVSGRDMFPEIENYSVAGQSRMRRGKAFLLRRILADQWVQRGLIAAFLIAIYWDGVWGAVPRADQLIYLHQIGQFHDIWNIWLTAPSWNRTESAGDFILFRPLLYVLLGTFYYLFHYNFDLWKWGGLTLHIVAVMGAYTIFAHGTLRRTYYPFLLSIIFGSAFLGSEMVLWSNIVGYLLFAVLFVYSVHFLARFIETRRCFFLLSGWLLAVFAEFTYEIGVVINLLAAATFLVLYFSGRRRNIYRNNRKEGKNHSNSNIYIALLFTISASLYPLISIADIIYLGMSVPPLPSGGGGVLHSLFLVLYYSVVQLGFWFGGWLLPAAYNVRALGRATFTGFNHHGALFILNVLLVFFAAYVASTAFKYVSLRELFKSHARIMTSLLFVASVFSYSIIIAWGRTLPRGLGYVLHGNIYYAYTAYLMFSVGLGLFFRFEQGDTRVVDNVGRLDFRGPVARPLTGKTNRRLPALSRFLLPFALTMIIAVNGYSVARLCAQWRYQYSPPIHAVIVSVSRWLKHEGRGRRSYFEMSPSCTGDALLPWFGPGDLRRGSGWVPPVTLADVLWPNKSYRLNRKKLEGQDYSVSVITCPPAAYSAKSEVPDWRGWFHRLRRWVHGFG